MHIESLSGPLLYLVAFLIIFSENGFFFLFFLPGDSLLFALGLLANDHTLKLWHIIPLLAGAAIIGNILAYYIGSLTEGGLARRKWFSRLERDHLVHAKVFYDKYGVFAVLFARFVPVIRTFVPFVAGMVSMNKRTFSFWSIVGGAVWVSSVTLIGYFFGKEFNLQQVAFLGSGMILAAVIATPIFIAIIHRIMRRSNRR